MKYYSVSYYVLITELTLRSFACSLNKAIRQISPSASQSSSYIRQQSFHHPLTCQEL